MFPDFLQLDLFPLSPADIIINLLTALCCGIFIAWLYRKTYKGPGFSPSFISSMVLLTLITAMVIMIIGNNLARAFGLVGAMSIIRFRTAIKDTIDIVFIFFSLGAGLAAGAGALSIALIGTVFIGAIVFTLDKVPLFSTHRREYLLQFTWYGGDGMAAAYLDTMNRYCRKHRLVNASADHGSDSMALSFYVQLRDPEDNQRFIREMQGIDGVRQLSLYYDDEQL